MIMVSSFLLLSACGNKENAIITDGMSDVISDEVETEKSDVTIETQGKRLVKVIEKPDFDYVFSSEEYEYDSAGNLTKILYYLKEDNLVDVKEYDVQGNLIMHTAYNRDDPSILDFTEEYTYDDKNNMTLSKRTYYLSNNIEWEEWEYDDNGNMTKHLIYDGAGDIDNGVSYKYDVKGNLLEEIEYGYEGEITRWHIYEYNDKNLQIQEMVLNNDGTTSKRYEKEYDEQNRIKKINEFDEEGELEDITEYSYDENGNQIEYKFYRVYDGRPYQWHEWIYNDYGQLVKEITHEDDGSIYVTAEYEYDSSGNKIRCVEHNEITEWNYDSTGNVIKEMTTQNDGEICRWYEWAYDDKGNQILSIERNEDGTMKSGDEWAFDQYGNMIKSIHYYSEDEIGDWFEWGYAEDGTLIKEIKSYRNGENFVGFEYLEYENGKPVVEHIYPDVYKKYEYNETGQEIKCSIYKEDVLEDYIETIYDDTGDIIQIVEYWVSEDMTGVSKTIEYIYEPIQ